MDVTVNEKRVAPRPAPVWLRVVAFMVDLMATGLLTGIPTLAISLVSMSFITMSEGALDIANVIIGFLVFTTYHSLVPVPGEGRTAGMFLCGIRIVNTQTLETPTPEQLMKRGLALALSFGVAGYLAGLGPFYITGPLAMAALLLPVLVRSNRRALHDLVAGTRVIQQRV